MKQRLVTQMLLLYLVLAIVIAILVLPNFAQRLAERLLMVLVRCTKKTALVYFLATAYTIDVVTDIEVPTPREILGPYLHWRMKCQLAPVVKILSKASGWVEDIVYSWKTTRKKRASPGRPTGPPAASRRILVAMTVIAASAQASQNSHSFTNKSKYFDTDSFEVGIDNRASGCMSHVKEDFVGPLKETGAYVKGFGGVKTHGVAIGTLRWSLQADDGTVTTFDIPGSYYIPQGGVRLLSPQHLVKICNDHKPSPRGTWMENHDDCCVLWWDQRRHAMTIPVDQATNVFTFRTAPGYTRFDKFTAETAELFADVPLCYSTTVDDNHEEETESSGEEYTPGDEIMEGVEWPAKPDEESPSTGDDKPTPLAEGEKTPHEEVPITFELPINQGSPTQEDGLHRPGGENTNDEPEEMPAPSAGASAEFQQWHERCGHIPPSRIQAMARNGILPARLAKCHVPMCPSCTFGKANRRPWQTKAKVKPGKLSQAVRRPGDVVSVDQLESTTPGLVAQLRGRPTHVRYKVATVFVDHISKLSYVHLQQDTSGRETLKAKMAFEKYASSRGVTVRHWHCDNGRFADKLWRESCDAKGQTMSYCGVNAHFQNGVAEKRIRDLCDAARTMIIHAHRHWPTAITPHLWPYAVRHANDMLNHTLPKGNSLTPAEIFSGTRVTANPRHWHTWGCPVYVLDNALQAGQKINKWNSRARVAVYLGQSPNHARSIGLALNLTTGNVSPQFHMKWDSSFDTLKRSFGGYMPESKWQIQCGFTKSSNRSDPKEPMLVQRREPRASASRKRKESPPSTPDELRLVPMDQDTELPESGQNQGPNEGKATADVVQPSEGADSQQPTEVPKPEIKTRSGRTSKAPSRLIEGMEAQVAAMLENQVPYEIFAFTAEYEELVDDHPIMAYAASADPDTMYMHEAMQQPDKEEFLKAMEKEVSAHFEGGSFVLINRSQVPRGVPVVPSVWQMKRKRRIKTREIYKWKARLNLDGSKQVQGVNYWETFAPVASWPTIRLVLALALNNGWPTKQIDYTLAFCQADVEHEHLYMELPKGYHVPGSNRGEHVLHIRKNIYGQKQGGRVWYQYLSKKLMSIGFEQSSYDDCLFYRGNCLYVLYTDDSILTGPDEAELNQVIADIEGAGLDITDEGDIGDFLGVQISTKEDEVHLTQPHLTSQILKDLRLDDPNVATKDTPLPIGKVMHGYKGSKAFDGHFDFRSVLGKMMYLKTGSRPDIAFAVHNLARFASDPKKEHGDAMKWLGRYLAKTQDKGMIYRKNDTSFECFVDASFAGEWDKEAVTADDSTFAKSRTGYVIKYAGCPILWNSRLQTVIALSSTEAEVIALSEATREVLPLMRLAKELDEKGFGYAATTPVVRCTVFEDNSGAVEIARVPKIRPRTKHLCCQIFHFRHHVENGDLKVLQIGTKDQEADIFTKSVDRPTLRRLRLRIQGWDDENSVGDATVESSDERE